MRNKKLIIILIIIVPIIFLLLFLSTIFITNILGEKSAQRNNLVKLINRYIDKEEYDRALDKIEELLLKNPDDKDVLALQDKVLDAKKNKNENVDEKERKDRQRLLDSMTNLMDKNEGKTQIVRSNNNEKPVDEKKKNVNKLIEEGIDSYNKEDYTSAKSKFLKALELDSNNAEANAFLGATLYEEKPNDDKNVEEAIKLIKKALKQDNNLEQAHLTLAKIYDKQNLTDLAKEEYKETLKLNPNNYEAFYSLGKIYYMSMDYRNAESNFANAVKIKPDYVAAIYALASTEFNLNNLADSKRFLNRIIQLDPGYYKAYYTLGEVYFTENDFANALFNYEKAVKINNKFNYYQKIGDCYKNLKQPDKAVESYSTALSLNPANSDSLKVMASEAYESLAEIEKNRTRYTNAIEYIDKGLKLNNKSSVLYYISAYSKSKLGKNNDAVNDYLKALDINPKDIESYINLSGLYNEINQFEKSVSIAQKGILVDSKQYKLYNNLGDSLQSQKNYEQAISAYKKSIDLYPSSAVIYYNLGICYKETNDKDNATRSFQQAVTLDSKYLDAYYELGELYFLSEKYKEAKSVFTVLLNENPKYSKREKVDRMLSIIGR